MQGGRTARTVPRLGPSIACRWADMAIRTGLREFLWMAAGAAVLAAVVGTVMHFHDDRTPSEQIAERSRRTAAVDRMSNALGIASEAEKSAVLAVTDEDSKKFADQARVATADVERARQDLAALLSAGGTQDERDSLARFSEMFAELRRIDDGLLELAVRNTNLKATALAFGPAADSIREMTAALDRIVAANTVSADGASAALLARRAEVGVLRLQTLLAPHIAEESDAKMDELERRLAGEDAEVRKGLDGLASLPEIAAGADLAEAAAGYARFADVRKQILALSRENTNVRSLSISLDQKRKAMRLCREALAALRQAVEDEPVPGLTHGPPARPR